MLPSVYIRDAVRQEMCVSLFGEWRTLSEGPKYSAERYDTDFMMTYDSEAHIHTVTVECKYHNYFFSELNKKDYRYT